MTISDVANRLRENNDYIIITHARPDGDTTGSGAALCNALQKIGKRAYLFNNLQFPDCFPWLTDPFIAPAGYEPEFVISVDLASEDLFPEGFSGHVNLCIDHHQSNSRYAEETYLESNLSSCGEIILKLIKELCGKLEKDIADQLYVAVSTDTGCFLYGNTTADTLRAGAELCEAGASNAALNKILFRTSSKARLLLEGLIFSNMSYYHEGKTVIAFVTKEMMKSAGATDGDLNDIASLPGRVKGAITSAVIKEVDENNCKISLRSNGQIDANVVCKKFSGGGHAMASGCYINKPFMGAAEALVKAIGEEME